ncbi:MAG: methyltransferase domain-containing protein, partial [Candidatus Dormibacteraeota bacterium]|nr:methyltransferase domain-containing protein [Candidatus Dormibacteraeota bacterium]
RITGADAVQSTNGSRAGDGDAAKGLVAERPTPAAQLPPLTGFMVCPACRSPLRLESATVSQGRTKTGRLVCDVCRRVSCLINHFKYDFHRGGDVLPLDRVQASDVGALGERRVAWSDPAISYGRGWRPPGDGFMTSAGNAGDSFAYTGTFTDAQARFLKHPHGGIVDVFLDDQLVGTADLYMPVGSQEVAVPVAADLPLGEHTILVMARGAGNPGSGGCRVPFEELVLFGPESAELGFTKPGPINRGNGYPEVVTRWIARMPPDQWILECGGGDRRMGAPNVVNFEYLEYELADIYGDAHRMPFRDGTFGLVFTQAVFEHLRNPFEVARELVRVTRPGGFIVTEVAFLQPLHAAPYHYFNMTHWGVEELFGDCTVVERGWQGSLAFIVDWLLRSVNLEPKIGTSRIESITREFRELDELVDHEELKPAASGVWVVVRKGGPGESAAPAADASYGRVLLP